LETKELGPWQLAVAEFQEPIRICPRSPVCGRVPRSSQSILDGGWDCSPRGGLVTGWPPTDPRPRWYEGARHNYRWPPDACAILQRIGQFTNEE